MTSVVEVRAKGTHFRANLMPENSLRIGMVGKKMYLALRDKHRGMDVDIIFYLSAEEKARLKAYLNKKK